MKLMMVMSAGCCFVAALALGYVQDNTLPTTLLRAVIAMLVGLFLARWWGLSLRRQISSASIEGLANKQKAEETQQPSDETEQTGNSDTEAVA
tara:strand:+ start:75 stop:353 length:279 start_codon:yes stop_codon:yes gene_type:complete